MYRPNHIARKILSIIRFWKGLKLHRSSRSFTARPNRNFIVDCNLCRKIYGAGSPRHGRRSLIPPRTHRVAVMKRRALSKEYEENRDLRSEGLLVRTLNA